MCSNYEGSQPTAFLGKALVLEKRVCPLANLLPQMEEFRYLRVYLRVGEG